MQYTSVIQDNSTYKVLMLDANIIIPFLDKKHDDCLEVENELNRLYGLSVDFYYSQPCLLEILNYWRIKWLYNACLLLKKNVPYLPKPFYGIINNAETELHTGERDRYLYDHEVKRIRTVLSAKAGLWERLIATLNGKIATLLKELAKTNIAYAKFNSTIYPVEDKDNWPKWENG